MKQWFKRGKYPLEGQFADWIDSFVHKNEDSVPITGVDGLADALNRMFDRASGEALEKETAAVKQRISILGDDIDRIMDSVGSKNGITPLDAAGHIPALHMPKSANSVVELKGMLTLAEYNSLTVDRQQGYFYLTDERTIVTASVLTGDEDRGIYDATEIGTPQPNKLYIDITTNNMYVWDGTKLSGTANMSAFNTDVVGINTGQFDNCIIENSYWKMPERIVWDKANDILFGEIKVTDSVCVPAANSELSIFMQLIISCTQWSNKTAEPQKNMNPIYPEDTDAVDEAFNILAEIRGVNGISLLSGDTIDMDGLHVYIAGIREKENFYIFATTRELTEPEQRNILAGKNGVLDQIGVPYFGISEPLSINQEDMDAVVSVFLVDSMILGDSLAPTFRWPGSDKLIDNDGRLVDSAAKAVFYNFDDNEWFHYDKTTKNLVRDLDSDKYALKSDIPVLDEYALKSDIPVLDEYALKSEIPDISGKMEKSTWNNFLSQFCKTGVYNLDGRYEDNDDYYNSGLIEIADRFRNIEAKVKCDAEYAAITLFDINGNAVFVMPGKGTVNGQEICSHSVYPSEIPDDAVFYCCCTHYLGRNNSRYGQLFDYPNCGMEYYRREIANLRMKLNVAEKALDGVFILYYAKFDNRPCFVKPDKWRKLQDAGEIAAGVMVMDGGRSIVVAPTGAGGIKWSSAAIIGSGGTNNRSVAILDFDGASNTASVISASSQMAITDTADFAPGFCSLYSRLNAVGNGLAEGKWWLPSAGEMAMIYANMPKINHCLNLISGAELIAESWHWTSTECNSASAFSMHLGSGDLWPWHQKAGNICNVRPVSRFE